MVLQNEPNLNSIYTSMQIDAFLDCVCNGLSKRPLPLDGASLQSPLVITAWRL